MKNFKEMADIDFDAVLASAKTEHARMAEAVSAAQTLPDIRDARDKWSAWTKTNLTDRGIRMTVDAVTGVPRGLFVFVAGSES